MEVKVHLRQLRIAPRKVRLVASLVRGLSVVQAEQQLRFANKAAANPILKLLLSGVANAASLHKVTKDQLYLKSISVGDGTTLKRWQPRAMGRATPIRKRASHVILVLTDKPDKKK
ncbi:MAG: 50S ribosomal protein L22 [Patescibacteria group bacterium]